MRGTTVSRLLDLPIHFRSDTTFHIEYRECEAGWIRIYISANGQTERVPASHIYDPFPDLIAWLENIITGVPVSEFTIDEEGYDAIFRFSQQDKQGVFTLHGQVPEEYHDVVPEELCLLKELLRITISPRLLVNEFYTKFRSFVTSPAYHKDQWEYETLADRLSARMAGLSETDLLERLLAYPRHALAQLFSEVALDQAVWVLPVENFDALPEDQRRQGLQNSFRENLNSYNGTKLGELRSARIEEWLLDQEE